MTRVRENVLDVETAVRETRALPGLRASREEQRPDGCQTFAGDAVNRGELEHGAVNPRDGVDLASRRFAARSTIASNTGCTSVGELAITRRISAVAVCCSSDSFRWARAH